MHVWLSLGYQTRHRFLGCMRDPWVQWKVSAKAARFCSEPSTLWTAGGQKSLRRAPGRVGARVRAGALACGREHLPVLQGTVDVSLDGLDGKLGSVGPTPHLRVHEGRGYKPVGLEGCPWLWRGGQQSPRPRLPPGVGEGSQQGPLLPAHLHLTPSPARKRQAHWFWSCGPASSQCPLRPSSGPSRGVGGEAWRGWGQDHAATWA